MKIQFGMVLDGAVWTNKAAAIGHVRTGPMGLLGILESNLGLAKAEKHLVYRIDDYMKRLKALDNETAYYHQSFSFDQWSTARQMLAWRDELLEAGWSGQNLTKPSARLKALTDLENSDLPLSAGRSDRLRRVIAGLEKNKPLSIASITLLEPCDLLPPVWQEILTLLKNQGVQIDSYCERTVGDEKTALFSKTNLSRVQAALGGIKTGSSLADQDESLVLLEADNEWAAAQDLALWLASRPDANKDLTIICSWDSGLLDQALRRFGLPSLGRTEPSKWRELQQVFPLILANAWKPIDIRLLVDLLSLTQSPLARWVCGYLLNAIAEEPGVGGRAWNQALEKIKDRYQAYQVDQGPVAAAENAEKYISDIQALLVEERFDPEVGIPEDKLQKRCQRVITWASRQVSKEVMMGEVISQARDIQMIARGKGFIPRITLNRMLDTVIGIGTVSDYVSEQAAPWQVVDDPGQILDPCSEIVWWGFNEPASETPNHWSKEEGRALEAAGLRLEASSDYRYRQSLAWQKGLMQAKDRFIGITISRLDGEEAYPHPFFDTILSTALQVDEAMPEEAVRSRLIRKTSDLKKGENWQFAGRQNALVKAQPSPPLLAKAVYQVPRSIIKLPKRLSYSQMSTLIGCPMKWALEYHAGLRLPESQAISTGNQMIGKLCHRIIEDLYSDKKQIDSPWAVKRAGALYDQLLESMASELLRDGKAIERQRYRQMILEAVRQLVEVINQLGLEVLVTEAPLEGVINNISFIGYADILLRDRTGKAFVLDLKWSSSSKYKKEEIEKGGSLQLASYAWMIRSAQAQKSVDAGYFMLAQGQLISDSPLLSTEATASAYSLEEVWQRGLASLEDSLAQLDAGVIEAHGIKERLKARAEELDDKKVRAFFEDGYREKGLVYQNPPCYFCHFQRLCGLEGGGR